MKKGLFITFEGPDSSGKTTQAQLLREHLTGSGHNVVVTREPGGTDIGEQIRNIILDKANVKMDSVAEAMLYAAARAQIVAEIIRPALEQGITVVCDRFVDSSLVYQGQGRGLGNDAVETINAYAVRDCVPDVTFLLKVNPETGADRRQSRENDRIENEKPAYHKAVYEAYLALEKRYPQRIVGIDGTQDVQEISRMIRERVEPLLCAKNGISGNKS
ncbi:MAG: dTMP kinase [Clostridiales Family XIII bacterium]|jgi:dTMP kinase|nr:dTMP kinase [Clostridiales Family XIII bacterium]